MLGSIPMTMVRAIPGTVIKEYICVHTRWIIHIGIRYHDQPRWRRDHEGW
jgi:hypothetical protein